MPRPPRPILMALLADVKQNPDDLTPWLVLCDWLEEQDDEADRARGEYCRLCFDKLGTKTVASDWEKGERRRHLYRTYRDAWLGPILPLQPRVEKGLLTIKVGSSIDELEALEAATEECAWIGTVQVEGWSQNQALKRMSNRTGLGWLVAPLHTLDLCVVLHDRQVKALASWSASNKLRVLKLTLPELNFYQADCLIESPHLAGIDNLEIRRWRIHESPRSSSEGIEAENRLRATFGNRLTLIGSLITYDE